MLLLRLRLLLMHMNSLDRLELCLVAMSVGKWSNVEIFVVVSLSLNDRCCCCRSDSRELPNLQNDSDVAMTMPPLPLPKKKQPSFDSFLFLDKNAVGGMTTTMTMILRMTWYRWAVAMTMPLIEWALAHRPLDFCVHVTMTFALHVANMVPIASDDSPSTDNLASDECRNY